MIAHGCERSDAACAAGGSSEIHAQTRLPELFVAFPAARAVFNRYGLRGCGGAGGPAESIEFFARTHGVDLDALLAEVREVADDSDARGRAQEQLDADDRPRLADSIYRPFFLAGLLVILTVGAGWGVLLLLKIGSGGSFTGVTAHEVNAHGHAQVMGWVGLFIMGFAYQAFPRMWQVDLPRPSLALGSLAGVVIGIASRATAMMFTGSAWALPLHNIGVAFQVVAVATFLMLIVTAFVRSRQRIAPSAAFILTALSFFFFQTLFSGWHVAMLMAAPTREALLEQIATYQAPLRDVQIHGMAMLMIFGVGLRMFPALFGFAEVRPHRAWWAYGLLACAVLLEVALFLAYRAMESRAFAGAMLAPWLMLPTGTWLLIGGWKPWRSAGVRGEVNRSRKFVRAAFAWLFVSFGLLLAMPGYLAAYEGVFSHAYHGAIRHAITVGFVSMMIMGMGAKVVATLNGLDTRQLTALWGPFVLVNTGCLLRVTLQVATDWTLGAFPIIGVSGALELIGLGWWSVHIASMMLKGRSGRSGAEPHAPRPMRLASYHTVGEVVRWYPAAIDTLADLGFAPVRNPVLQRTLARRVTLAQAASIGRVPLSELLGALNARVGASGHEPERCGGASGTSGCACCDRDCEPPSLAHVKEAGVEHRR